MKHLIPLSKSTPARASVGIGLFEKIQILVQNILDFLDGPDPL